MNQPTLKELETLSPFELKDFLIETAQHHGEQLLLNAGRGNPNFLATIPRHGFFQLGLFAMQESERYFGYIPDGVGGLPDRAGIEMRFEMFLDQNKDKPGISFLKNTLSYVSEHLGLNIGDYIFEVTQAILGCMYPTPPRMLQLSEKIVAEYIRKEMIGNTPFLGEFDVFAVEGGTAAIAYLFTSLKENHLLNSGDSIAIGMPIFSPYIEIPALKDYNLVEVSINADPAENWQIPKSELDKLLDPKIKAFFLVNPSNPPSVRLSDDCLAYIAEIIKKRPDLLILTDDVYGTFANNFTSLFAICPQNTILVYSFSKYFGSTGWRLGVIVTHHDNIMDKQIAKLPKNIVNDLNIRYQSITTEPKKLKFIDRVVADSRTVALNHTAGLSTPAQVQMVMFSLFALMDSADNYKKSMKQLFLRRINALYRSLGVKPESDENEVYYYHLLDMELLGQKIYEPAFITWLLSILKPNEFLFKLAQQSSVVLLPSNGFGGPEHPSARISLANLTEAQYIQIGKALNQVMADYYEQYKKMSK